jgi:hypothetical protein
MTFFCKKGELKKTENTKTIKKTMQCFVLSYYVSLRSEFLSYYVSLRSEFMSYYVSLRSEFLSYYVSLRSEFRVVMSVMIST